MHEYWGPLISSNFCKKRNMRIPGGPSYSDMYINWLYTLYVYVHGYSQTRADVRVEM